MTFIPTDLKSVITGHALQWSVVNDSNAKQTGHLKILGYRFDTFVHQMNDFKCCEERIECSAAVQGGGALLPRSRIHQMRL